jgi:hypothetical protein
VAYDNYRLLRVGGREAHREYGIEAGRFTREQILKAGLWPKKLPLWQDPQEKQTDGQLSPYL